MRKVLVTVAHNGNMIAHEASPYLQVGESLKIRGKFYVVIKRSWRIEGGIDLEGNGFLDELLIEVADVAAEKEARLDRIRTHLNAIKIELDSAGVPYYANLLQEWLRKVEAEEMGGG